MNYKILTFQVRGDERGKLVSLEEKTDISFNIKRVYYIYETDIEAIRGKHAHQNLQQVVVCLHGNCTFLLDDGKDKKIILLDSPEKGLFIGKNMWREMHNFSSDCVLMVLASGHYDEKEYIRDYEKFLKYIQKNDSKND